MEEPYACAPHVHRCSCPSDDVIFHNNNSNMKGVNKSLLTEAFFQSIIGMRGKVVSWQPFEVNKFFYASTSLVLLKFLDLIDLIQEAQMRTGLGCLFDFTETTDNCWPSQLEGYGDVVYSALSHRICDFRPRKR